jgi:hypothetical protein
MFFNLILDGIMQATSHSGCFTPGKGILIPIEEKVRSTDVGTQKQRNISAPSAIETRIPQLSNLHSGYHIDWTIAAHMSV